MSELTIEKALIKMSENPFSKRSQYEVSTRLDRLDSALKLYNIEAEQAQGGILKTVSIMTPEFQRANDKWDLGKKVRFIENVLAGFRQSIVLFYINGEQSNANIIDGLQRLTSFAEFTAGEFPIYDGLYFSDINTGRCFMNAMIGIKVFEFRTLSEAITFYIEMNEGFTHSSADIEKAKVFRDSLQVR